MTLIERILIVAFSFALAFALVAVGYWVSLWVAAVTVAGGALLAMILTVEPAPKAAEAAEPGEAEEAGRNVLANGRRSLHVVERATIARRAEAARDAEVLDLEDDA